MISNTERFIEEAVLQTRLEGVNLGDVKLMALQLSDFLLSLSSSQEAGRFLTSFFYAVQAIDGKAQPAARVTRSLRDLFADPLTWGVALALQMQYEYATIGRDRREQVAAEQHAIWSNWMRYLFSMSQHNEDGTMTIPADLVSRWRRQMDTHYDGLSFIEQESDRHQADKVLFVLRR